MIDINEVNNEKSTGEAFKLPSMTISDEEVFKLVKYNGYEGAIQILCKDTFKEEFAKELVDFCVKKNG